MKRIEKNYKNSFRNVKQKEKNNPKKSLKDKIRELIKKNEETIKKYEKLKEQTKDSQKKMDYLKIISKIRTRQISLQNKLHSLDLIINSYSNNYENNILNTKSKLDTSNILKNTLHKRINSSDYNYGTLYTNNNILLKYKNNKKSAKVNSTNNLDNQIPKPTKINPLIQNKKKEIINYNKNLQSYVNVANFLRINTNTNEYINNSTMLKETKRQNNNNNIIKSNNKKEKDNAKNIIIINNINNYFGKIENTSSNNNNSKMSEHIINNNLRKKIKDKILKYNIIDEDEKLDIEKNYENNKIVKEKDFKSTPLLAFTKKILNIKKNVIIEIYNSFTDKNKIYVAISEKSFLGHNIKIFKFKNRKFVTRLKRHKNRIISIKYFFNQIKMHDFLISGDTGLFINIWDISYKFSVNQFLYTIKYQGEKVYNLLPAFIQQKENNPNNYLLVYDKSITIYDLQNGEYIKNINHSRLLDEKIINIILWKNKDNNFDYIIKCAEYKITIFNFIDSEIFFTLSDYTNNEDKIRYITEGFINSGDKNESLCILSYSSYLLNIYFEIWDLYELNLKEKIIINRNLINDAYLLNMIPWNYKYILLSDGNQNCIYLIDLDTNKIISNIKTKYVNDTNHIYFKKIISKDYGECLIAWKHNNHISLFSKEKDSIYS